MSAPFGRLLGIMPDSHQPIYAHKNCHSILTSAAGTGKTTAGAMIWLLSQAADMDRSLIINDCKSGELAAQTALLLQSMGRKVALIDDFNVLGKDHPCKVSLNPLGNVIDSFKREDGDIVFASENANHALIADPPDDQKNQYFRDEPRNIIEFAQLALLKRRKELAIPGGLWGLISDPGILLKAAHIEMEEGDDTLKALGAHIVDMSNNKEHWGQHRNAALKALRIFSARSPLHSAGGKAVLTHARLLREKYIVFIVGPQQHMERLGPYYGLHLQSFIDALMGEARGQVDFILDECTNAPLKALVSRLTTMRSYGGNCHFICQSRSELQRAFGEKETATIEDNAIIKQWFGFSSFEEAERISKATGEASYRNHGLNLNSGQLEFATNLGSAKDRVLSADRLMRMGADEQLIHIKDVGFFLCKKVRQNQIAPYCHGLLADNPLEGPQMPADSIITIPTPKGEPS